MKVLPKLIALIVGTGIALAGSLASAATPEENYTQGLIAWEERGDPVTAIPPLRLAAEKGHAAAQALLAYLLDYSDEDAEAAALYRKAAEQGDADGMFGLATFYVGGDGGLKHDLGEALRWMTAAAEKGHPQAIIALSQGYSIGSFGLKPEQKDSAEALKWTRAAIELDHVPSMERMVQALRTGGLGLQPDLAAAQELETKLNKLKGVDPNAKKKRRKRL